jgi:hypothetical protein
MRFWWVNQNQTFQHEVGGGDLWSEQPLSSSRCTRRKGRLSLIAGLVSGSLAVDGLGSLAMATKGAPLRGWTRQLQRTPPELQRPSHNESWTLGKPLPMTDEPQVLPNGTRRHPALSSATSRWPLLRVPVRWTLVLVRVRTLLLCLRRATTVLVWSLLRCSYPRGRRHGSGLRQH